MKIFYSVLISEYGKGAIKMLHRFYRQEARMQNLIGAQAEAVLLSRKSLKANKLWSIFHMSQLNKLTVKENFSHPHRNQWSVL